MAGLSWDARGQTAYSNSVASSQATPVFTLNTGDSLTNSATGSVTITSGASGYAPAVAVGATGALFILNQGTLQSQQTANGIGIGLQTATSLGTITNSGTGLIQASGATSDAIQVGGVLSQLVNSATIQATGAAGTGIHVISNGSVGAVTNSGTVQATQTGGSGISVGDGGGGKIGTLTNNGIVLATGASGTGIKVVSTGSVGSIVNGATGTIASSGTQGAGISVAGTVGSIANQGTVNSTGDSGTALAIGNTGTVGTITNATTGTIIASGTSGVAVGVAGVLTSLQNAGIVSSTGTGGSAVNVGTAGLVSGLTNAATGTIAASGSLGTAVVVAGALNALMNSGKVQANGAGGTGVNVLAGGAVGTLTNATGGSIVATTTGIAISGALTTLTNSGMVMGTSAAVAVLSTGTLGTISNNAGGTIQGGTATGTTGNAIDTSAALTPTTINNSGSIVGALNLVGAGASAGDTVNLTAGTLTGNINGNLGLNTVNLNGGTIAPGFTVSNLFLLNVNTCVLNTGTGGVAIVNNFAVDIASGATLAMNGGTIGVSSGVPVNGVTAGVNNAGVLNVGTTVGSITGAYNQSAGGAIGVTVNGTNYGSLAVTGAATFSGAGNAVALHFTGPSTLTTMTVVTTTGGITINTVPVVNSDSPDPYYNSGVASQSGNNLVVSFTAPTFIQVNQQFQGLVANGAAGFTSTGLQNEYNAIQGVQGLIDSLFNSGNRAAVETIFNALGAMTTAQQKQFFQQVQPGQIGAASALLASALTNNGGLTTSVDYRVLALLDHGRGMAAGDEVGRGFEAWVRPFGETFVQGTKEGITGFTANSYGFAAGGDTLISPDVRLGGAFGLSNTDIVGSGLLSGNKTSDLLAQAGIYATYFKDNYFLDAIGAFGYHWYDTKENISYFGSQRTSTYNGVQFSAKVTAGYDWHTSNGMVLTPNLTFQEIHVDVDAHTTSGAGLFNQNVSGVHFDVTQLKMGGRVAYPAEKPNGWTFTPEFHAYYVRNLDISRIKTTAAFTAGGAFSAAGPQRDADLGNVGLGLTISQKGPFVFSAVYDLTVGETTTDNMVFLRAKTEF